MNEKLNDIVILIKNYNIQKGDDCYVISHRRKKIEAVIGVEGNVKYYISECYNNCSDYVEIPINELQEMKVIVQSLLDYKDYTNCENINLENWYYHINKNQ